MRGRAADRRPGFAPFVSEVSIRLATPADLIFIVKLGERTVMDSVSAMRVASQSTVVESFDRLIEFLAEREHIGLIATLDDERVGFTLMVDDMPDEVTNAPQGFIAYMAVEPALRGRGVGAALLESAEDEARRRGLPYMALMVTEENEAARRLYDGAGYRTERRLLCKRL
jgi:ribosomal protein S18 acetylase RimI-like enzyme